MSRPLGITIISVLTFVVGVSSLVIAERHVLLLPLGLLLIAAGYGLWKMRVWGAGLVALISALNILFFALDPAGWTEPGVSVVVNLLVLGYLYYHRHTILDANDYPSAIETEDSLQAN